MKYGRIENITVRSDPRDTNWFITSWLKDETRPPFRLVAVTLLQSASRKLPHASGICTQVRKRSSAVEMLAIFSECDVCAGGCILHSVKEGSNPIHLFDMYLAGQSITLP